MLSSETKNRAIKHLAKELLRRADHDSAKTVGNQSVQIQLDVTIADVATLFGLTRPEATYALNRLKREGLIVMEGSTITITDLQSLATYAQ